MTEKIWIKAHGYVKLHGSVGWPIIGEWRGDREPTLIKAKVAIEVWLNEHFPNEWEYQEGEKEGIPFYNTHHMLDGNVRPVILECDDPSKQLAFSEKGFAVSQIELLRDIQQFLIAGEIILAQNTAEQYRIAFRQAKEKAQENIQSRYKEWEGADLRILDYEGKR